MEPTGEGLKRCTDRNTAIPELTVVVSQRVTNPAFFDLFHSRRVRAPSVLLITLEATKNLTKNNAQVECDVSVTVHMTYAASDLR